MLKPSILCVLSALLLCCSPDVPPSQLAAKDPGLQAEPKWLTFTCVEPGCDTIRSTVVEVIGDRDVAIKRVVLSDRERTDFVLTPSRVPPFVLKHTEKFQVEVNFLPDGDPRLGDVDLRITYTDASGSTTDDGRIEPGELSIPFVRRLIGEPLLEVSPNNLNFGAVLPTARKTLPLTLKNVGFGNVGLVIDSISPVPVGEIQVSNEPTQGLVPDETWDIDVTFAPIAETYFEGVLRIKPVGDTVLATNVPILATSISRATIAVDPETGVDFGEVPIQETRTATLGVQNRGGEDLTITQVDLTGPVPGATLEVGLARNATIAVLGPLESTDINLDLETTNAGMINTHLRITSDDPQTPVLDVPVTGLITKPVVAVSPLSLDFGTQPRGWTRTRSIEVSNSGFGQLLVTSVQIILGSSELFTLVTVPSLPITLGHDERAGLEIEFRSEAEATFNGMLAIDTNDPDTPFVEVPLLAIGASCDDGCPISNGTPTCLSGNCEIDSCDPGWFDADLDAATGCECQEVGSDPGTFCAEGHYVGSLGDEDNDRANFTGILPTQDDVDVIRFFGDDQTGFLDEDYDVRVTLESTDPGITMCVYHHKTSNHLSECFWESERCGRSYRKDGSLGPDDSADYLVKIFRSNGSTPACTPYTVFMRNG